MGADALAAGGQTRPLQGIEVVDVTGPFGAYAGRLLADLGAHVTRIVPPSGDPLVGEWPFVPDDGTVHSAYAWFVNADKDVLALDLDNQSGRAEFERILAEADILLESWGVDETAWGWLDRALLKGRYPRLIVVSITPFGIEGPDASYKGTDLNALAAGGLLSLGGYDDTPPIAAHGQARLAASIFGAAAAIMGLIGRDGDGRGRLLDVAAQEVIAAALEDAIPQYDLTGVVRRRAGDTPREAGTGIYRCSDGFISMVAGRLGTAKAWKALVAWLVEAQVDGAQQLKQPEWDTLTHRQRPESIATFKQIFESLTASMTKEELYAEAQRRDIALAPVNEVSEVLEDKQLAARQFFVPVHVPDVDQQLRLPGRPYRLSGNGPFEPFVAPVANPTAALPASPGEEDEQQPAGHVTQQLPASS